MGLPVYESRHFEHCNIQHWCAEFRFDVQVVSLSVLFPQLHFSPVIGSHMSPWPWKTKHKFTNFVQHICFKLLLPDNGTCDMVIETPRNHGNSQSCSLRIDLQSFDFCIPSKQHLPLVRVLPPPTAHHDSYASR